MKNIQRILVCGVISASVFGLASCSKPEPEETLEVAEPASAPTVELTSLDQRVSYGIGRNIGNDVGRDPYLEVDIEALVAGLRDSVEGRKPLMSTEEVEAAFVEIRAMAEQQAAQNAAEVVAKSDAFLAQNASRPEVKTTESGLQYEVLTEGTGPKPTASSRVKVHYHGTLVDGAVFDSSVERGEPIAFSVTGVISGWTEALQLMPVGSKWKLFIPSELAYGDRGQGSIPGGAALIFEVELLEIL